MISLRRLYLYIASFLGLILIIIGAVGLVNLGLKTWVFPKADTQDLSYVCERPRPVLDEGMENANQLSEEECQQRQEEQRSANRQRDAARDLAFLIVGTPLWYYHWNKVKDDKSN